MARQEGEPAELVLEGPRGLRLLAHEARQRVIAEVYDGRELTATEAAEMCGLTPSAMSYHLRMLEKAGVLVPTAAGDGRERRYRRAARSFQVRGAGGADRVQLQTTVSIWVDSLGRAVQRWVGDPDSDRTAAVSTESFQLTDEQSAALLERLRSLFAEYGDISESNAPDLPTWETYWAYIPRVRD